MKRRILAWVLLIGFILLLLNLLVFRFYMQLSVVVYLVIMFAFLLTNGRFNIQGRNKPTRGLGDNIDTDMGGSDDKSDDIADNGSKGNDRDRK